MCFFFKFHKIFCHNHKTFCIHGKFTKIFLKIPSYKKGYVGLYGVLKQNPTPIFSHKTTFKCKDEIEAFFFTQKDLQDKNFFCHLALR